MRKLLLMLCMLTMAFATGAAAQPAGSDYAESAMLAAIGMDGREELALRIARNPGRGTGTIWLHLAIDGLIYSAVEEDVPLPLNMDMDMDMDMDMNRLSAATPWSELRLDGVRFTRDAARGPIEDRTRIAIEAELRASPRRHPQAGDGFHPVTLSLDFRPDGRAFRVHGGTRREVYGEVRGTVTTPERTRGLTLPARWHEQWGPRARFAPSFTYLNLQNEGSALLAIRYAQGTVGYLIDAAGQHRVTGMEIDAEGSDARRFRIEVEGRSDVTGTARVMQRWSVPIEGLRRPGSGVVAETSLGTLAGSLNDWEAPPLDAGGAAASSTAADRFLLALARHCGAAWPGRLALEPEGDPMLSGSELLLAHFRDCGRDELAIPFHIEADTPGGWDSSRTWYLMRTGAGLELRHDHRRADGSEDQRTWYGGATATAGSAMRQDFVSPERSAAAGTAVGWRIEIEPGAAYRYGTTYAGEWDWMVAFDLSEPYDGSVPDAWGHHSPPSRIPGPP